ncbi:helix-turn-helix domain-containing protein [Caballeronia sp. LZ001]|uniref:helix-turn-helix domain-containing protein n=1 Tax=Caballeronia sp. LZ001 TaxID=3038553 RepID=UPI00285E3338|nr:helix-turn-helix domain-containing protein [Caballeronia sp. LZ001]MDR5800599.1 hypothetical protein [Caballeronia sp. LZ001]
MDIKTIIQDLISAGMTQMEIERQSGVDQSTISGILSGKRGKRPSYRTFDSLQRLHSRVAGSVCFLTHHSARSREGNSECIRAKKA